MSTRLQVEQARLLDMKRERDEAEQRVRDLAEGWRKCSNEMGKVREQRDEARRKVDVLREAAERAHDLALGEPGKACAVLRKALAAVQVEPAPTTPEDEARHRYIREGGEIE